ncbi:helix-turn-helix transcriptional regulator [Streptomyces colonosanans]|uniref:HTH luxR-type domain-containing protein n=1 Tax=Streptomyces colonosanans TaxID=1428652 RepID=A0A1S2PKT3_9ACTN|nr:helix-turn-helix transcriptional regulator [Streptomyces colonosanans]OIJ94136.1 hypothetical protein BIV24_11300 [Streptomyces colonosanans]
MPAPRRAAAEPVLADAYADTVLSCLHRGGPAVLALAQVLAVVDEEETDDDLPARMLDAQPAAVAGRCGALETAGLLSGTRLWHPAARAAVLRSLAAPARRDLHRRAAVLLHADGAAATRIAPHLLAAAHDDLPWAVAVLRDAAGRHLAADRIHDARACLAAAPAACRDDGERAGLRARLAATAWLLDPSFGARHFEELATALRDGLLPGRHALDLARHLLWPGRFDEAALTVRRAAPMTGGPAADPPTGTEVRATRTLLSTRGLTLRVLADTEYGAERIALLTEAVAVLRAAGDSLQTADALAELARGHLRTGLATAARLAGRCGARPLAAALAAELEALAPHGRRPGERRGDGAAAVGPLSAAERRVAVLAADGHTNKEISHCLRGTVSTVEQHLTRVYRKLGVRARRDLASACARDAAQQMAAAPAPPRPARDRAIPADVSGSAV